MVVSLISFDICKIDYYHFVYICFFFVLMAAWSAGRYVPLSEV
jgi:hypothetical protein